ncbi:MAG: GHKL domain-containing protein [Bacteroidetes bacterium]|nr:GHKL domain-containing protein [Bacteroidota bacterium]
MRLLFLVIGILTSLTSFAQSLSISRTYNNLGDELGRSVWGITQDKRGVIYLATERGVIEYDGVRFHPLDTPPAFGIISDSSGVIYVSCKDDFGQLVNDAKGVIHYQSLFHFNDPVTKFEEVHLSISANKVAVVSYKAALEYDRKKNTTTVYYPEPDLIFSSSFIQNDTIYTSVVSKGLYYLMNGKVNLAPYGDWFTKFHQGKMNTNLRLKGNERLLVFGPTIIRYAGKDAPPALFHLSTDFLKDSYLYSSFSVNDQEKIITTLNKGAVLFDTSGTVLNTFNDRKLLPGNAIPNGLTDHTGNNWFGFEFIKQPLVKTEAGRDIRLWNEYNGLEGNLLPFIQMNGKIYIATQYNLLEVDAGYNTKESITRSQNFVTQWIAFKNKKSGSRLIAVSSEYSIKEYRNGKMEEIYTNFERVRISQSNVYPNRLYVMESSKFGYLELTDDTWKYHKLAKISNFISFAEDRDGTIWLIAQKKGLLARLEPNQSPGSKKETVRYFTAGREIPEVVHSMLSLNEQLLFISDKAIFQFNKKTNTFEAWRGAGKKLYNLLLHTTLIQKDTVNNMLHLVSNNKVISLTKDQKGDTLFITKPYQRFENIGKINSILVDHQGILWMTGNDGVLCYDRTKDKKNYDAEFQCLIRSVVVGNDSILSAGGLLGYELKNIKPVLPYNFNKLSISYAAPFFDKEEETLYSYFLIGRDQSWSVWEKNSVKEYNDLFEGKYTFQVKAMNIYGKESSISSITFTIQPPWYRTWWMYLSYAIVFGLLSSMVWRWRTQSLRNREKILQKIVQQRTTELVKTNHELQESHRLLVEVNKHLESSEEELKQGNEELSATNEHLMQMQKQLVEKEKMASLGQLTAGIAHEINNPINFISGGVQAMEQLYNELLSDLSKKRPEEIEEMKEEIKNLMGSINNGVFRTSAIIKSLRTFSSPVESIDELGRVDVKECALDALTLLRDKIQRTKIDVQLNFDHTHGTKANASLLTQVFVNLIDNAIYALQKITTDRVIQISTAELTGYLVIKVKDNAGSIPPGVIHRIFEPFYTTKEVGTGTGLGLWICYSIIEKHSGSITVVSNPENGTEFKIMLPIGLPLIK